MEIDREINILQKSFQTISGQILKAALHNLQYNDSCRIVSDRHTVKLPLRVELGRGLEVDNASDLL